MNRDEWDALADDDSQPAIRFCVTVAEVPESINSTAIVRVCEWCSQPVWVDMAQELPHEARETGAIPVCQGCALAHPVIGPSLLRNLIDVYDHWRRTGVIKAIKVEEEDT